MPRTITIQKKEGMGRREDDPVTAILCSDLHLRDDVPRCRLDDNYFETQMQKLRFIVDLSRSFRCPILCGGDVFDWWKVSPNLLNRTIRILRMGQEWFAVPGQHDLPRHNLSLVEKAGIWNLVYGGMGGFTTILDPSQDEIIHHPRGDISIRGVPYGGEPGDARKPPSRASGAIFRRVVILHRLCYREAPPYPGAPADGKAGWFFKTLPEADLILTGDNHQQFTMTEVGRLLVNPGSMMRMSADQVDHHPGVFLWKAGTNTVERVEIPHMTTDISREHLEDREKRDARIEAFVSRLTGTYEVEVNFRENLKRHLSANRIPRLIAEAVWDFVGGNHD